MHLTRLAAQHEDKPAVVMGGTGEVLSYRELENRSNRIAHLLRNRGLRPGDHIAILMENELDVFPVVWAAQRTGLLYTPVNWHLARNEAAYIVDNCGARLLVHNASLEELARAAETTSPALESRLVVGAEPGSTTVERLEDAVANLPDTPVDDEVEGYYMFYSSGTTGRPKGIVPELTGAPFGTGMSIDAMMAGRFGFGGDTVYLSPGPLYHAAPLGWCVGTVRNGGTAVVMERFDAEQTLKLIDRYRVTHAQFVPTMFVRMLKLPDEVRTRYDVSSLCVVVHAAAPCPVEVKERMIDWFGPKLVEFYSGSEGTGFFMIGSEEWLTHKGSVGRAVRGAVHICDDDGNELPVGEVGTVWFGDVPRFEYHGDPEKTASVFDHRGWNTLGDLGQVDAEGYLYLSARRTDLILSGGVNIYPQEIEDALILHPAVADVAVIGLPDEEMGQRVHAVVQPAAPTGAGPDLERELVEYCRDGLAHYKSPKSVSFEEVPRMPSGKILRRELLARYTSAPAER
ncbi:AMP-binding protein [Rhodococcus aetherivorans]|uniref:AMP-binding protein n=1 Tax=Rhodococcus aetherivorans TaxID=191292 RepID=UPI00241CB407|nr:AMP-binding protein [Rhodococcus aetherivorans]WFS11029.1 AMP-binding protein [Rhodococcus aetherivorans]